METRDNQNDDALVARVLVGERAAFDPLLLRYYASVLRLCQRLLGPTPKVQDVAQYAALHGIAANLARRPYGGGACSRSTTCPSKSLQSCWWSSVLPPPEDVQHLRRAGTAGARNVIVRPPRIEGATND